MIFFHRFLIGTAIVFCAGTGFWMINASRSGGSTAQTVLGVAFLVATIGLVYYLKNLSRFLNRQ